MKQSSIGKLKKIYGNNYYEDFLIVNEKSINKTKLKHYLKIFVNLYETIVEYYPFEFKLTDNGIIEEYNFNCDTKSHFDFCLKKAECLNDFKITHKSALYKMLYSNFLYIFYKEEFHNYQYHLREYRNLINFKIENHKQVNNLKKIYNSFSKHDILHNITENYSSKNQQSF